MAVDFAKHTDAVFRFSLSLSRDRFIAEELAQECFARALEKQHQLRQTERLRSWLFQIAYNLWRDRCRRRPGPEPLATEPVICQTPLDQAIGNEQRQRVFELMQKLPERQRSVLYLAAVEQFSNDQISQLLSTSKDNVKATLSIARRTIREKLQMPASSQKA